MGDFNLKFKIGDRVKVYDVCQLTNVLTEDTGIIENISGTLLVKMDTWGTAPYNAFYFHPKQCRKLIVKKQEYLGYIQYSDGTRTAIASENNESEFEPVTRERYRQMKLLNKRRWQQIQELEIKIQQLEKQLEK